MLKLHESELSGNLINVTEVRNEKEQMVKGETVRPGEPRGWTQSEVGRS